jgi:AcrR family transcriptional regulator
VTPVQERSRRKIDAILDATAALLGSHGVEAASILAIAEAAEVPPATVYHYFENRLAIFAALAERTMAVVDTELTGLLEQFATSGDTSTRDLLQMVYSAYHDAPGYVAILRALRAEPTLQELVHASNQRMADVIAGVLLQRTTLAEARALRVARIISECCEQVLQVALTSDAREATALLDELTEMVDALFLHYIALN